MAKNDYEDVRVLCPFYDGISGGDIKCHGPVADTKITWHFQNELAAREQHRVFCQKHWKRCEMSRCIIYNRNYEDE